MLNKHYLRVVWFFGLGDLFRELCDVATVKELHDLWMTCRIYAHKRPRAPARALGLWQVHRRKGTRQGTGEDHLAGATGGKEAKRWQVPQADPGGGEC